MVLDIQEKKWSKILKIKRIIWYDKIIYKLLRKHNVTQQEIVEIFANKPYIRFVERGHRAGENVYSAMSQSDGGRYLIVYFILKEDNKALILSARDMSRKERKKYERK